MWIVYMAIPLGSSLMCFRFLQVAWQFFRSGALPHHDIGHVEGVEESASGAAAPPPVTSRPAGGAVMSVMLIVVPLLILAAGLASKFGIIELRRHAAHDAGVHAAVLADADRHADLDRARPDGARPTCSP